MVFSSIHFLFLFLPVVLLLHTLAPGRLKNGVLIVGSVLFYVWGGGILVFILFASVFLDSFAGAIAAEGRRDKNAARKRLGIAISLVGNLGLLACFKYASFALTEVNAVLRALNLSTLAWPTLALPIGISFYTFQSMSYTLDVARGAARPVRRTQSLLLYVILFPQLIAGPIVRFAQIESQLSDRQVNFERFGRGALRFAHGLFKKVVLADTLAPLVDSIFELPPSQMTFGLAVLAAWGWTIQLYFDFSGYSDMAIGIGRMLGFDLPENFKRPLSALSMSDFWSRWHMTLTRWVFRYLLPVLPRHSNRTIQGALRLGIVGLVVGLWHGAAWTYVAFGAYLAFSIGLERILKPHLPPEDRFVPLRRLVFHFVIMLQAPAFRGASPSQAGAIYAAFLQPSLEALPLSVAMHLSPKAIAVFVLGWASCLLPRDFVFGRYLEEGSGLWANVVRIFVIFGLLPYALASALASQVQSFIYFQF